MSKLRQGIKIDSSKLRTKITEDIYKDDIGYYYRCGDAIIICYVFNCKLCGQKTANCNQAHTCAGCTRMYNQGYRNHRKCGNSHWSKDGSFLYVPNKNLRIITNGTEYRGVSGTSMHKMFKHKCDKCNTDSLYTHYLTEPHTPTRCHYCYYLKKGGTPHVEKPKPKPKKFFTKFPVKGSSKEQQQLTFNAPKSGMVGSGDKIEWTKEERDNFNGLKDGLVASGREDLLKQNWTEEEMDKWERELRDIWIKDEKKNPYKSIPESVPIQDSTPVKYVDDKEDRHQMFFNLFNDMISKGGMQRKLNGAILSLPSEYPWADKGRIDHFFHDPTEYLWYENQPGKLRSVKYVAKQLNKIMVDTVAYRVYDTDIMKSRHTNVGLANLDLECTMNPTIMEDAYEVIKAGLIGRKRIGFTLNTYGRGPKNMTLDKRDSLWNGLLNRFINDGHSIKYTSGRLGYTSGIGSTMFLFGAVIEQ